MKVALFGGTFDPVHVGHLAVAQAAADKFELNTVYFVPADIPPHKQSRHLTDFQHRFAMLALATADDRRFVPSLLDAPKGSPNYTIDTVRRVKRTLKKSDKLYFLIGMDAFKDIATWYQPEALLAECEFIVVSRPGSSLADIGNALPEKLRQAHEALQARNQHSNDTIALPGAMIHLLPDIQNRVSSTQIRAAVSRPVRQLSRFVPRTVAEYIKKEQLYAGTAAGDPKDTARSKVLSFQKARPHVHKTQ